MSSSSSSSDVDDDDDMSNSQIKSLKAVSNQPKCPAVPAFVIVRQNGLSSASSSAHVAVTPLSLQI